MPSRPASPVVIVVLAAVGALAASVAGVGSYLGVANYLKDQPTASGPGGQTPGPTDPSSPGAVDPSSTTDTPCPDVTIQRVQANDRPGNLVIVLYVRGTRQNGDRAGLEGEAWICRDSDGELYYQGHDIDGTPPRDGNNTVFVGGGINGLVTQDGSTYVLGSRRVSCTANEFRVVGGTRWSVDTCIEGAAVSDAPTTLSTDDTG